MSTAPRSALGAARHGRAPEERPRHASRLWAFMRIPGAVLGAAIVLGYLLAAGCAPLLAPSDPLAMAQTLLSPPGHGHVFGTDQFGRDILSRLLYGSRVSLGVAFASVAVALAGGGTVGVLAGYYGGRVDNVLLRTMEVIFAFPAVLLAIAIMAVAGTRPPVLVAAIGLVYIPQFARVARGSVVQARGLDYVEAARAQGARVVRVLVQHILPNIAAPIIVQTSLSLSFAILTESALSFLGLGTQPPTPSWGNMLADSRRFMTTASWTVVAPGVTISLIVLGFNLLGDGLRDLLDPRLRV